ncbi:MAG: RagB/SusD family nutrient uptake outer membrane protein [Alistipes sp.]|nr:RagB/SusD family nutrient uptake outer membrane protein [Alistipes sp.]
MNNVKNIFAATLAIGMTAFSIVSCTNDFLDEYKSTLLTTQYFDTPEGLREMAAGLPNAFRLHSAHEYSYPMTNYGTDEFTVGSDSAGEPWNNYDARLQSTVTSSTNPTHPQDLWDPAYVSLSTANIILDKAPTVLEGESDLVTIMAEARFVRAWIYFWMVQQWGGVPLLTEPVTGLQREFERASVEEVLTQVIEDFTYAYENLVNVASPIPGKIYKDAAAHYLAKALVYRQCEIHEGQFSATKDADLAEALRLCDEVIGNRQLAPDFMDLWDYWGPDGANESLNEIILAAQYSEQSSGAQGRYTNMLCLQFVSIYQNWPGMIRNLEGGREFARLRTTDYAMDVYDRVNDSRFWKSFRTTQTANSSEVKGFEAGPIEIGQVSVMYIINDANDYLRFKHDGSGLDRAYSGQVPPLHLIADGSGGYEYIKSKILLPNEPGAENLVPNVIPRYREAYDDKGNPIYYGFPLEQANSVWPTLSKYLDGARKSFNDEGSQRDVIKARLAETYLLAAEIKVRQGQYQAAITDYINPIRRRAEYKSGEDRAQQKHGGQAYVEAVNPTEWLTRPSSFCPVNTYYVSNNIPETYAPSDLTITSYTSLPPEDEAIIAALGYTSDYDRMLCFILNERSRELMGELLRWEDLARTKTLIDRALTFNMETARNATIKEHHYRRPIPQSFLDEVWKDGRPLTAAEKKEMQNPGYN